MNKILIFFFFTLVSFNQTYSQEIKVLGSYSHTNYYDKYESTIGYGIGYNYLIKLKNKLGFVFYHSINADNYEYTFISDADGIDYYRDVKVLNQRFTLSFNYAMNIYKGEKSNFFIGPELALNFFMINEEGKEASSREPLNYKEYHSAYNDMGKLGIGFLLEYERKISDQFSLSFSTHPELVFYSRFGLMGSSGPVLIPWLNFNMSLQYTLRD